MSGKKITYSTELMVNFKQAKIVAPQKKFEALQTADGNALLFSISSDNKFYVTQQTPGLETGWKQFDLSSGIKTENSSAKIIVKTFAVSQNFQSGKIDLALVLTVDGSDILYLSLNNKAAADDITTEKISWTIMPYDDPDQPKAKLDVENLYIAETKREQYIVADISRKTFKVSNNFLERYYIDPKKKKGRIWRNLTMGGDLDPGIKSCLGRKGGDLVDGIYTLGSINSIRELLYAPLYNPFDQAAPPTITRLTIPDGATALAVADVGKDETDLFVAADQSLYYFAKNNQNDGASGVEIKKDELFEGATKLYAFATAEKYVVWGINRANQIFYTSCLRSNVAKRGFWTHPLPILTGVDQLSPYLNIADTANTFFAVAGNDFKKAVQSPQTSIWNFENINVKPEVNAKAEKVSSYTTRIQLTDTKDQVLAESRLYLSASSRMPVTINNLYYVLTPVPLAIDTDKQGAITVVDEIEDLSGIQLIVTDKAGTSVAINPMEKAFNKIAALNSSDKLKDATIQNSDGSTKKLIAADVSAKDLEAVATSNVNINTAYHRVSGSMLQARPNLLMQAQFNGGYTMELEGYGSSFLSDVGDLFRLLESGISHIVSVAYDAATSAWRFIVEIAGKVYQGVLDCVEKVVGAIKWLYDAVKTAIEDLIKYLEFLFTWKDIVRTKDVIKNVSKLYIKHEVAQLGEIRKTFDVEMGKVVRSINDWSGIKDWKGLGAAADTTATASSTPAADQSAPGNLLSSHFESNAGNANVAVKQMLMSIDRTPIDTFLDTLGKQGIILSAVLDQIEKLATDFENLSLEEILKRIVGIIGSAAVETTQNVIGSFFEVMAQLIEMSLEILDAPVYIPVLSDILAYFGVPTLSILDLLCYIAAVPVTLGYKIVNGDAPFKDNEFTKSLTDAQSFAALKAAFQKPKKLALTSIPQDGSVPVVISLHADQILYTDAELLKATAAAPALQAELNEPLMYTITHAASGMFLLIYSVVSLKEALSPPGKNEWTKWSVLTGTLSASLMGACGEFSPMLPIKREDIVWLNRVTTGVTLLSKLIFSGPGQSFFSLSNRVGRILPKDSRSVGAVFNTLLMIPALVSSSYHLDELAKLPASRQKSAAIIDETSNITSYLSRLCYSIAVNSKGLPQVVAAGVMTVANIGTAGLQIAAAKVGGV
jgi:hypothetical protein